jgi:dihydrofolate reductase
MFDQVDGWGGRHPFDKPIVVVTHNWVAAHPEAPFTFVTDGLPAAIEQARAIAGDLDVNVTAGKIASQYLELGLLDELWLGHRSDLPDGRGCRGSPLCRGVAQGRECRPDDPLGFSAQASCLAQNAW